LEETASLGMDRGVRGVKRGGVGLGGTTELLGGDHKWLDGGEAPHLLRGGRGGGRRVELGSSLLQQGEIRVVLFPTATRVVQGNQHGTRAPRALRMRERSGARRQQGVVPCL